jgi:shikimate kinase
MSGWDTVATVRTPKGVAVKINLTIESEVDDADAEKAEIAQEIIMEEARGLVETVRQRLAAHGMTDIEMNVKESKP